MTGSLDTNGQMAIGIGVEEWQQAFPDSKGAKVGVLPISSQSMLKRQLREGGVACESLKPFSKVLGTL